MPTNPADVLVAAFMGVGATILMDVWNLVLKRTFGILSLDFCLLGRWLLHMPKGTFRHASIRAAREMRHECTVGWLAHYSIGVSMALVFAATTREGYFRDPTLLPAVLFGIITVIFPLFILQPALGLGIGGSKTPKPAQARLKSILTHTVFGIGLFLSATAMAGLFQAAG